MKIMFKNSQNFNGIYIPFLNLFIFAWRKKLTKIYKFKIIVLIMNESIKIPQENKSDQNNKDDVYSHIKF